MQKTNQISQVQLLGDSISAGITYDETKKRYVHLKNCFFSMLEDKLAVPIQNASHLGSTILKGMHTVEKALSRSRADVVAIEFGGNDCDFHWDEIAKDPTAPHRPNVTRAAFGDYLSGLIETLRAQKIRPVVFTLPPLDSERYLQRVSKADPDARRNILTWLGDVEQIYRWHETYNDKIIEIAQRTATPLIDVRARFLAQPDYSEYLSGDGIHPNEKGHLLIAGKIYEVLNQSYPWMLRQDATPPAFA